MKTISLWISCSIILIAALFSACQKEEEPLPKPTPQKATQVACDKDSAAFFDLQAIPPNGADYAFDLMGSPAFKLSDCFCKVKRYELVFDTLPDISKISIKDSQGNPVPFSILIDPQSGKHIITVNSGRLEENRTKIYVEIDENPVPPLEKAGGLCIVDNLGGLYVPPDTSKTHYGHTFYTDIPPVGDPIYLIIVPKVATGPYLHSIPY